MTFAEPIEKYGILRYNMCNGVLAHRYTVITQNFIRRKEERKC